ncbi:hypothetical protein FO519_010526, partial [Halicephalobus sp. NKZ332]
MKAARIYKEKYQAQQDGIIGITLVGAWYYPKDPNNEGDVAAARRSFQFTFGWFANPIFIGDYPDVMKETIYNNSIDYQMRVRSRLPEFTEEEINNLKGSADFLGVNYYMAYDSRALTPEEQKSLLTNYKLNTDWRAFNDYRKSWRLINVTNSWINYNPDGFRLMLKQLSIDYNNVTMMITENGCMDSDSDEVLKDYERIKYFRGHLTAVS